MYILRWASQVALVVKNLPVSAGRCKRHGFDPWVGKIPWRRKWQSTPVFLPGESRGWGSLMGYSHGVIKSWTWLKWLSTHIYINSSFPICPFPFHPKQVCFLHLWFYFCFVNMFMYLFFRFTCKWYHMIFASLWLISLSLTVLRSIHIVANGIVSFFLMAK